MAWRRDELKYHVGLAVAELICVSAFVIELQRALGGNTLSWAYVFEWPFLGGYAIYMWRQLIREERGEPRRVRPAKKATESNDAALAEWNAYLDEVHRADGVTRDGLDPPPR